MYAIKPTIHRRSAPTEINAQRWLEDLLCIAVISNPPLETLTLFEEKGSFVARPPLIPSIGMEHRIKPLHSDAILEFQDLLAEMVRTKPPVLLLGKAKSTRGEFQTQVGRTMLTVILTYAEPRNGELEGPLQLIFSYPTEAA